MIREQNNLILNNIHEQNNLILNNTRNPAFQHIYNDIEMNINNINNIVQYPYINIHNINHDNEIIYNIDEHSDIESNRIEINEDDTNIETNNETNNETNIEANNETDIIEIVAMDVDDQNSYDDIELNRQNIGDSLPLQ